MKYIINAKAMKALMRNPDTETMQSASAIIDSFQSRAKERRLTVTSMVDALKDAEEHLMMVAGSKKSAVGTSVDVDVNAQDFPSAYKWSAKSTVFSATYTASGWVIDSIERDDTARATHRIVFRFAPSALEGLEERMSVIS